MEAGQSESERFGRCYCADLEDGGRGIEKRNSYSFQKLEKAREVVLSSLQKE